MSAIVPVLGTVALVPVALCLWIRWKRQKEKQNYRVAFQMPDAKAAECTAELPQLVSLSDEDTFDIDDD